jgi:hypothetical protein
MPRKYPMSRRPMRRKMRGGNFKNTMRKWLGSANTFLKKSGLIGAIGREYLKGKNNPLANVGLHVASQYGYGKRVVRRRRVGGSLAPVGGMYSYGRR